MPSLQKVKIPLVGTAALCPLGQPDGERVHDEEARLVGDVRPLNHE